jgi:hypothetical protein
MNFFQLIYERSPIIQIVKGKEYDRKRHVDKSDTLFACISYPYYRWKVFWKDKNFLFHF